MLNRRTFLQNSLLASAALPLSSMAADNAAARILVDWHSHYVSQAEINFFTKRKQAPRMVIGKDGIAKLQNVDTVSAAGGEPGDFSPSDLSARIRHLDQNGIGRQLLTHTVALGLDASLPVSELRTLFRAFNDELAGVIRRYPDRFIGVAALPTADPEWAANELKRAHRELGLIGGSLPLNAFASLASAQTLTPLFKTAQSLGSHFFIHRGPANKQLPDQPALVLPKDTQSARWSLISNSHLTAGGITLGLTDFLDPYPDVSVEIIMLAGFTPYLLDTWIQTGLASGIKDPLARLRRLYLDPGPYSRNGEWVSLAANKLGADRILFGTDYGVGGGNRGDVAPGIAALDKALNAEQRQLIYVDNSRRLLQSKGIKI
ncbi:MAG: amidohydrolase family protein [Steroidobacteraceae bacterium]